MSSATQALEHVVTKSNKLVEASYRLSVVEQRILALLASKVAPGDADFRAYRFTTEELVELFEAKGNGLRSRIDEVTDTLLKRVVRIRKPNGWLKLHWVETARYHGAGSEEPGTVELSFSAEMKPYLLQLKECFTSYRLKNIIRLRSTYSVRLYELLMQYGAKGEREFKLDELRGLLAIESGAYSSWDNFKRRVLEPARVELAEHTDLVFTYLPRKGAHGRVVGVIFKFKLKAAERALKRAAKNLGEAGLTKLVKRASECLDSRSGKCDHTWEQHKDDSVAFCHWCSRFNTDRAELAGQTRLPGV